MHAPYEELQGRLVHMLSGLRALSVGVALLVCVAWTGPVVYAQQPVRVGQASSKDGNKGKQKRDRKRTKKRAKKSDNPRAKGKKRRKAKKKVKAEAEKPAKAVDKKKARAESCATRIPAKKEQPTNNLAFANKAEAPQPPTI